jgi:hypothetical protein
VEWDEQARSIKKKQRLSVRRVEGRTADVKPSTLEAIIGPCKSWVLIKAERLVAGVS